MPLKTIKRSCCKKFGRFFVLDVLKTKFWMENLTQRWTQLGPSFLQNQSTFFDFQEKGRGGLCLPPLVAGLTIINASTAIYIYWNSLHLMHPKTPTMAYLCHRTWLKMGVYLQDRFSLWCNQLKKCMVHLHKQQIFFLLSIAAFLKWDFHAPLQKNWRWFWLTVRTLIGILQLNWPPA